MGHAKNLLIDASKLDTSETIDHWIWLLGPTYQLLYMNLIGDLFLKDADGAIYAFWLTSCEPEFVAGNEDAFKSLLDDEDNRAMWLAEPLVKQLHNQGIALDDGQCFGWKVPPWLGGSIDVTNVAILPIGQLHGAFSELFKQVHDLPDGTEVQIKIDR